ncbi:MAG: restriction endonuclease subunit S, partial [Endomicrobium sp.]|nr:restriction endonuclease subunit S [Endomicrobium sp.]
IASIGKNGILRVDGACNQQINAIIPNDKYDIDYLYYLFEINKIYLLSKAGVTATPIISKNDFKEYNFFVTTDKSEQKAIASVLSDMDEYILSLERLIAKKKAIKQGAMQNLLTGKIRLAGFKEKWIDCEIGKIGKFYSGLTGKRAEDFGKGNARYITFLNVLTNVAIKTNILGRVNIGRNEQQNAVQKGDLFFNTSSETPEEVGMCAVLQDDLKDTYLNSFCFGYRLMTNEINPLFISYLFNSNVGRKKMFDLAQGATRYNLSKLYFEKMTITIPSIAEQISIVNILSDIDAEIEALQAKLNKAKFVKQGAMQYLLTGKIRLVKTEEIQKNIVQNIRETHNKDFEDAIVISAIVDGFYNPKYPLGRVKVTKLLYLFYRKHHADISGFLEKAAGPYDPSVRYNGGESISIKNEYITVQQTSKGARFGKGEKITDIQKYIDKLGISYELEWLINGFKFWKTEDLEVLATIDNARVKLERQGRAATVQSVVNYIKNSREWKAKRARKIFADDIIEAALKNSREMFD